MARGGRGVLNLGVGDALRVAGLVLLALGLSGVLFVLF